MPATLGNKSQGRRDQNESLDLIAGAGACRLVSAGDGPFNAKIRAMVMNEDSTISSVKADDENQTEVSANTDPTDLNIQGKVLSTGSYIIPHLYENGRTFREVTVTGGSVWVYYNDVQDRS